MGRLDRFQQGQVLSATDATVTSGAKVLVEVFGCQMNVVDAELVRGRFHDLSYGETSDYEAADVVVFNTCSVRGHAEDRVHSRLGALRRWKRDRAGRVIAVMGCMAQREAADIRRRAPHVDVIVGTRDFPKLAELVTRARRGEGPFVAIDGTERPDIARSAGSRPRPYQAYVTIMRGCDRPCTYCIVPTVRGPEVSRPLDEIVTEVRRLVDDGVVEVCLLGQTVNAWNGQRRGEQTLGTLLRKLDEIDGLRRLRFITSHPNDFDADTLAALPEVRTLDRFLHMPMQSGSDRILKAMKRGYTAPRYRALVDKIRAAVPDMQIGTDWIVGFPGETEEDFQATVRACAEIGFSQSFVFKYSPRPGTVAAESMDDDVPEAEKRRRNAMLLATQSDVARVAHAAMHGSEVEVLVEGKSRLDDRKWAGRDRAHRIVCFESPEVSEGSFARVRIESSTPLTLFGSVVESAALGRAR